MPRGKPRPAVLIPLVLAEVVSDIFAWQDLRGRSNDEIRGSRRAWRVAMIVNPGNSIGYWLFARKRTTP